MADLLLELFSEEIPARMQQGAAQQLLTLVSQRLSEARLSPASVKTYVTPRRVALLATGLPERQPDQTTERKGPKVDAPKAAIEGFLKSTGLTLEQLETQTKGKDTFYVAAVHEKGRPAAEALESILGDALSRLTWPKSMRWGNRPMSWVRPLHSICCLLDEKVVPIQFGHLVASNQTFGHRFLSPDSITIKKPGDYENALEQAHVIADSDKRRDLIKTQAEALAAKHKLALQHDDGLLDEVTGLVEWPVCLLGEFDKNFMHLPPEVLTTEMKNHQRYFALRDATHKLSNHFLTVSNMVTSDGGKAVIAGNGRVLRARLSDGQFFWNQDRGHSLSHWAQGLEHVIFHAKLGSMKEKAARLESLASLLAVFVPGAGLPLVARASALCKADLVTGMVGEFPELQGIMGRYYAQAQEEDPQVADAIRDHYKPIGASDDVPTAPVSIAVALADKMDSIMGLFAAGEKPTGSKDPFALRRAALGIIRIILENRLRLPLRVMFDHAAKQFPPALFKTQSTDSLTEELLSFFADRLKVILKDQGCRHDLISAVFDGGQEDDLVRLVAKAVALQDFIGTDDGANLLAAYRRASNIVQAEEKKDSRAYDGRASASRFELVEERLLFETLESIRTPMEDALEKENYAAAMSELAKLRHPVDAFFEKVMVNAQDKAVRENRLHLLSAVRAQMNHITNFALIEG